MNPRTIWSISVAITLVIVAGALAFYFVFVKVPADFVHNLAEGFRHAFNFTPQVMVDQVVVIEQSMPIAELAIISRAIHVDHSWKHTWLGSTKSIQLRGSYTAKAGFDLRKPFSLRIARNPLKVTAVMPKARILSLELTDYRVIKDESGWWNSLTEEDREDAVRQMQTDARVKAERSGIIEECQRNIEKRIRELVEANGATVDFRLTRPDELPSITFPR